MSLIQPTALPGPATAVLSNTETPVSWGPDAGRLLVNGLIDSATVDARGSPTTQLGAGLLLGKVTSTGRLTNYSATATDGSEVVFGTLYLPINMLGLSGSAVTKIAPVLVAGAVRSDAMGGLDTNARAQMRGRFLFEDDPVGVAGVDFSRVVAKTADYTVLAGESGTTFTNEGAVGAVVFTLPAVTKGLRYRFYCEAGQTITVTAPANKLVAFNNATATSLAFSTSSEKIGGAIEIIANASGTKWLSIVHLGAETQTPVVS